MCQLERFEKSPTSLRQITASSKGRKESGGHSAKPPSMIGSSTWECLFVEKMPVLQPKLPMGLLGDEETSKFRNSTYSLNNLILYKEIDK